MHMSKGIGGKCQETLQLPTAMEEKQEQPQATIQACQGGSGQMLDYISSKLVVTIAKAVPTSCSILAFAVAFLADA